MLALLITLLIAPAHAQGRVVGPGGTMIARVTALDDRCAEGGHLTADLRVIRVVRGFVSGRDLQVVFPCGAPLRASALVRATIDRSGVPVPGADFHGRIDGDIAPYELPGIDPRTVLGHPRAEIERAHRLVATDGDVSTYASGLVVRYESDVARAMTLTLPPGLDCTAVPAWLGLPSISGSFPMRRADGCEWPGLSERHVLAPGLRATLRAGELLIEVIPS